MGTSGKHLSEPKSEPITERTHQGDMDMDREKMTHSLLVHW
jgi:hypothetical protein